MVVDVAVTTRDMTVVVVAVEMAFTVCVTLVVDVTVEVGRLRQEHPLESAVLANFARLAGVPLL